MDSKENGTHSATDAVDTMDNLTQATEDLNVTDEKSVVESEDVDSTVQTGKKSRPTPESIAMDRGIQNVTRKVHKNNKNGDRKLVELLIHVFDNCGGPEEKMEALAKKYVQLAADQKSTEQSLNEFEGKYSKMKKEKDHLQAEYNKLLIAKGKLESLCRELQKHNKAIKEETQRRADEEDRKRKELSQKFQATISDITQQMADNHKRNQQLKQDNNDLAQKLKGLVEQYEVREQHIEKVLKAKQLELQLCEAKLQQQNLMMQEEVESNLKEKHSVLEESLVYKKKCEELLRQETELRSQLALYTDKFEEFQNTLTKSNEVFGTFKRDMDTMTKTIKKLEKESQMWKSRWENTNRSLIGMVDERTENQNTIITLKTKVDKLEKLCRALQSERKGASKKQNAENKNDISPTLSPEPDVEPNGQVNGTAQTDKQTSPTPTTQHNGEHKEEIPVKNATESDEKESIDKVADDQASNANDKPRTEDDQKSQENDENEVAGQAEEAS